MDERGSHFNGHAGKKIRFVSLRGKTGEGKSRVNQVGTTRRHCLATALWPL